MTEPVFNGETFPVKYHRIELLVLDDDNVGIEQVKELLKSTRHVAPVVISSQKIDVDFHDGHPLNRRGVTKTEVDEYFKEKS